MEIGTRVRLLNPEAEGIPASPGDLATVTHIGPLSLGVRVDTIHDADDTISEGEADDLHETFGWATQAGDYSPWVTDVKYVEEVTTTDNERIKDMVMRAMDTPLGWNVTAAQVGEYGVTLETNQGPFFIPWDVQELIAKVGYV